MERLTDSRGARAWFLYRLGWYLNLVLFLAAMLAALYFFGRVMGDTATEVYDALMMMSFVVLGAILLMGAGISRYQARLEGQHLEIKKTVLALGERISAMESSEQENEDELTRV